MDFAEIMNTEADIAAHEVKEQREKMKPGELAAADSMTAATEAQNNAKEISEKHAKAVTAYLNQKQNSPSEVAAENANIDLKIKAELIPKGDEKGYSTNGAQKIGAYAATAPILLQQLNALRSIDNKVTPVHPPSNHPPGERKPQFGPTPQKTVNGNVFSFPRHHDYGN